MSKSQFRHDVKRGNGQAYLTILNSTDREYYKNELLGACLRVDTLNTQDEPGRADYLYKMIKLFSDSHFYENAIIDKLKSPGTEYSLFFQLTDLLTLFGRDGHRNALEHLWALYHQMKETLLKSKVPWKHTNEKFDQLAICLDQIEGFTAFERITSDFLEIRKNTNLNYFDLIPFYFFASSKYGRSRVRNYLKERGLADQIETNNDKGKTPILEPEFSLKTFLDQTDQLTNLKLKLYAKKLSPEELDSIFEKIKVEPDPDKKLQLIRIFSFNNHPIDVQYLFDLLDQRTTDLSFQIYSILLSRPSSLVYNYSKSRLNDPNFFLEALTLMCASFDHDDESFLVKIVMDIKDKYDLHHVYSSALLELLERDPRAPKSLLFHYYQESTCSECRYKLVKIMGKRKLLTEREIKVLLHDCNEKTVNYALKISDRYKQ